MISTIPRFMITLMLCIFWVAFFKVYKVYKVEYVYSY